MAKNSVNGGIGNRSKTQERKRSKKRIKSRKCGKFMVTIPNKTYFAGTRFFVPLPLQNTSYYV